MGVRFNDQDGGNYRRRTGGLRAIAHVSAGAGYKFSSTISPRTEVEAGALPPSRNLARQCLLRQDERRGPKAGAFPDQGLRRTSTTLAQPISSSRRSPKTKPFKRKIYGQVCPVMRRDAIPGDQHIVPLHHRLASATDRPERFMGIPLHEPRPGHELVSSYAVSLRRKRPSRRQRNSSRISTRPSPSRRFSRLHRQSHPVADDQRGYLHAL